MVDSNKLSSTLLIILVTFFALILRTSDSLNSSFFFDEAVYSDYAQHPIWTEFYSVRLDPPLMPLLAYLIKSFIGSSEIIFRIPSVIVGCATVYMTYLLGRKLGGMKVGLMSSTLLAFNVLHQQYSQAAITHVYFAFFTTLALYGIRKENTWLSFLGVIGAAYINDLSIFLFAAYAIFMWFSLGGRVKPFIKILTPYAVAYLIRIPDVINALLYELAIKSGSVFNPMFHIENMINHLSLALILGFLYFTLNAIWSRRSYMELYLIWGFIIISPILLSFERYLLFILPTLTIIGLLGLSDIYKLLQKRFKSPVCGVFGFIFFLLLFSPNHETYGVYPISDALLSEEDMVHKQQWGEAALLIDGGVVLVSQNRPSMEYYLDELGKDSQVIQFDSAGELQVKLEIPEVNWVVVRNFGNGYEDYEDMRQVMDSSKVFKRAYELEHVILYERLDK